MKDTERVGVGRWSFEVKSYERVEGTETDERVRLCSRNIMICTRLPSVMRGKVSERER